MRGLIIIFLRLFCCFPVPFLTLQAQSSTSSSAYAKELSLLIEVYEKNAGDQYKLFNGREYARLPFYIKKGIPFFTADTLSSGTVAYDGSLLRNVPLLYDLINDELITGDITGKNLVKLNKPLVDSFTLYGSSFVHLRLDKVKNIASGYYQVLYKGRDLLLKKETKYIIERTRIGEELERSIESKTVYIVFHNDQYYSVSGLQSLASVFGKDNAVMKEYIRSNRKREKKASKDVALRDALIYYDQQVQ